MKTSNLTFAEGFLGQEAKIGRALGNSMMAFDWDKAAKIIKNNLKNHKDLIAEAGLQKDWEHTGGEIFNNGKPTTQDYTYLSSNWATPTLILSWDGIEQDELECFTDETERFNSGSKWDNQSLQILGIKLNET